MNRLLYTSLQLNPCSNFSKTLGKENINTHTQLSKVLTTLWQCRLIAAVVYKSYHAVLNFDDINRNRLQIAISQSEGRVSGLWPIREQNCLTWIFSHHAPVPSFHLTAKLAKFSLIIACSVLFSQSEACLVVFWPIRGLCQCPNVMMCKSLI